MTNAKKELLEVNGRNILCAKIDYCPDYETINTFVIKAGHTKEELDQFLDSLDFEYDAGYGSQHIFGTIWIDTQTWAIRNEYDGSEWWAIQSYPEIPEELK